MRVRTAIEGLRTPRLDHEGMREVTRQCRRRRLMAGDEDELIAATDAARYVAELSGKNGIVQAAAQTTNVVSAE